MQTLTFTQKLLRQRRFLNSIIPLLALFLGLGATSTVRAQSSTASIRNVIVTYGASATTTTTDTFDATPISATTRPPSDHVFDGTDFGQLDVNDGRLLLQGGSIQIIESGGETYNRAFIDYGTAPGTFPATPNPVLNQTVELTTMSYNSGTMTRTFSLSAAGRNILMLATAAGNPQSYRFDIALRATGADASGRNLLTLSGGLRESVFTATGIPVFTPTLTATTIFISPRGTANVTYNAANISPNPNFNGADLGAGGTPPTFDVNTGQLVLNGGTATTTENGPNTVSGVTLYYRVRGSGTGGAGFTQVPLTQGTPSTLNGVTTRTFSLSTAAQNLLAGIGQLGMYNVDVYFQASIFNSSTNTTSTVTDNNSGTNYVANFTVAGTVFQTTTWTGGVDDNWFNPSNWDNGEPSLTKNAIIPNFPSGNTKPYPNIYSDAIRPPVGATTVLNPDGSTDNIPASPGYNNTGSGNAQVRNLTLQGNSQLDRSILRLIKGRLDVFGDFTNPQGSFIQRAATVISFKADGAQTISGSINGFVGVEIDGGVNSVKTLTNNFVVKSGGFLKFINGILQTNIGLVSTNFVSFEGQSTDVSGTVAVTIPASQLIGETETSFFRGFLTTTQQAPVGSSQNFSNIGLALTFTTNDPGNVTVTRNNGGNYPSTAFGGAAPKPGIRRVFGVQPSNPSTQTRGLSAKLEFRYLTNELRGLQSGSGPTIDDDATKLSLYVSNNGGNTFTQLGRDANANNLLTKNVVTTFATFTLNETTIPLPVTLTKFDAKRVDDNALLSWETASELNSKGFNVQVSTDGKEFRTIGFVASASPNSVQVTKYSFTDTEKNKLGLRYYRLAQVDVDGTITYFSPRIVSFEGKATEAGLVIYPNPFTDNLSLNLQSTVRGIGTVRITDTTGRLVVEQQISLTIGNNDVPLSNVGSLKDGIYLVKAMLPTGEVKNLKVVKQ